MSITKEEFEKEGWVHSEQSIYIRKDGKLGLGYNPDENLMQIGGPFGPKYFTGSCSSIDEFREIIKSITFN